MATASEILDQAIRRLNELSTTSPVRWTRAELLVYLNDALNELNLISGDYQNSFALSVNNTASVWNLPSGLVAPFSVYTNGGVYLLKESVEGLDRVVEWENPAHIRKNITTWAPLGFYKVVIFPRPQNETDLTIEGLAEYTPLTDSATQMSTVVRAEYEGAIVDFIISRAMFKEGGAEFHQAMDLYNRFIEVVSQLSHRNIVRREPAWTEMPKTQTGDTDLRGGLI